MIVKDESHIIEETLEHLKKYISFWVISDTGSTDNTKEIIENFFKKEQIPGELVEHEWEDFGTNRTLALQACWPHRSKFDYIWVFDADDLIVGDLKFPKIRKNKRINPDMFAFKYGDDFTYMRYQLFKSIEKWEYVGVLHEYPKCVSKKNPKKENIEGNYYIDSRRLGARSKAEDKYLKDAKTLEKGLLKEPDNVRYMFYLGQSYMDAKDYDKAIEWYKKRATSGGWFEEVYYSLYRIATCMENRGDEWEEIEKAYLEAWKYLQSRTEPLYQIAKHYRIVEEYEKGYNFAKRASMIPFPKDQKLFIFKEIYEFNVWEELAWLSHYTKRYQDSFDIANSLILKGYEVETIRDLNIEFIKDQYIKYPIKQIVEIRKQKIKEKNVIFTMTTCKRFDLFEKTINSFINCCKDYLKIDKWLIVDDNSSNPDREKMEKLYPFIDFIWKSEEEKGHIESMNIILDEITEYKYNCHMEDDWQFFERRNYITEAIEILEHEKELGQLLFNINYAERLNGRQIIGGFEESFKNRKYVVHEYIEDEVERKEIAKQYPGKMNCFYWPHYSLRPSVLKVEVLKEVGIYKNETGFFEMDYAKRYYGLGYRSAFLDTICCFHIGKCTWEKGDNAYTLNQVDQFQKENDGWIIVKDKDSYGNDICYIKDSDIEFLKTLALQDPNCIGFNTLGYLKSKIDPPDKWINVNYPNFYMYINKEKYKEK